MIIVYIPNSTVISSSELGRLAVFYLSLAITILATVLIIFRIVAVVKHGEIKLGSYKLTMELVIESGLLYAAALTVTSILIAEADSPWRHNAMQISVAVKCWKQSLVAVAVKNYVSFRNTEN